MVEESSQPRSPQFVLLVLQLPFGETYKPHPSQLSGEACSSSPPWVCLFVETLQSLLHPGQWRGRQLQQVLAGKQQVGEVGSREVVAADAQGCFHDADGEGLATVAQVFHVTALGFEKFAFRVHAVRPDDVVEHVFHLFEVRLAVP